MPIRKRLSDPFGQETREFNYRLKYGELPKAPRKPSAEERKPFHTAIMSIPVGKKMTPEVWRATWMLPLMQKRFVLWEKELAIYPTQTRDAKGMAVCTGVQVRMLERIERTGQFPTLTLSGDKDVWYGKVIRWIEDNCYAI